MKEPCDLRNKLKKSFISIIIAIISFSIWKNGKYD